MALEVFEMEQTDPVVLEAMAAIMTHTLKPKQILRTIVNDIPCSAVIMTDKRIMAVKGINKGTIYDSAEAWTTSLAITSGCATMRGITVDEKLTDDVLGATSAISAISAKEESDTMSVASADAKASAIVKKGKKSKKKCIIPKRNAENSGSYWLRHVYDMMLEAEVALTDEIIDAFNAVVTYINSQTGITSQVPYRSKKYETGVKIRLTPYVINGIHMGFNHTVEFPLREHICKEIFKLYMPLYDMISPVVMPYMERLSKYHSAKQKLDDLKKQQDKLYNTIESQIKSHEHQMQYYNNQAKAITHDITYYKTIMEQNSLVKDAKDASIKDAKDSVKDASEP